jgi:Family of unknown function (DUF5338)
MGKTLEQRIAERLRREDPVNSRGHRAAFFAQKDEIAQALAAGWSVKDVWRTLSEEGRITVGYPAFNDYVNRWIREPARPPVSTTAITAKPSATPAPTARRTTPAGFTLAAQPNKEDIV